MSAFDGLILQVLARLVFNEKRPRVMLRFIPPGTPRNAHETDAAEPAGGRGPRGQEAVERRGRARPARDGPRREQGFPPTLVARRDDPGDLVPHAHEPR